MRECLNCKKEYKPFPTAIQTQKFCSRICYNAANLFSSPYTSAISKGKVGAIAELIVAADLIKRGYEVFRSVSQDSSSDLLILKHNKAFTVEVKSSVRNRKGKIAVFKGKLKSDILASFIHRENVIIYNPNVDGYLFKKI